MCGAFAACGPFDDTPGLCRPAPKLQDGEQQAMPAGKVLRQRGCLGSIGGKNIQFRQAGRICGENHGKNLRWFWVT